MRYTYFKLSLLLMFASFGSAVYAKNMFNGTEPIAFEFMDSVIKGDDVAGYPLLGVGQGTKLFHLAATSSSGGGIMSDVRMGNAYYIDIREGKPFAIISILANLQQSNMNNWIDEPCKRDNYIWKKSIGGTFSNVNCAVINHIVKYATPTGEVFQRTYAKFRDMGFDIPPTVVRMEFVKYASGGRFLRYQVTVNPELFGIERQTEQLWAANAWYRDFYQRDPKKVEFINILIKWAESVQVRMDSAFEKNLNAFDGLSDLYSLLSVKSVNESGIVAGGNKANSETKLIELKDLFKRGLITESQYNEQVKNILNNN